MNINHKILEDIQPHLYEYGCNYPELRDFVDHAGNFEEKQKEAIKIINSIITRHGKAELLRYLSELARVENGIRELKPEARDHVVHALLCFILGIWINEKFFKPVLNIHIDPFQWKIAGLFHDVGYPIQVATSIMKPFAKKICDIQRELGISESQVVFEVFPRNLEQLMNKQNSLRLIQKQLKFWDLEIKTSIVYKKMIRSGAVCHGMISALSVLKVIDCLYQKNNPMREYNSLLSYGGINWDQMNFECDIVPACAAVFIHNLSGDYFLDNKIVAKKAPLVFLLKLSDSLQNWERPSKENPAGSLNTMYDIGVEDNKLIFKVENDADRDRIEAEIDSTLKKEKLEIVPLRE